MRPYVQNRPTNYPQGTFLTSLFKLRYHSFELFHLIFIKPKQCLQMHTCFAPFNHSNARLAMTVAR